MFTDFKADLAKDAGSAAVTKDKVKEKVASFNKQLKEHKVAILDTNHEAVIAQGKKAEDAEIKDRFVMGDKDAILTAFKEKLVSLGGKKDGDATKVKNDVAAETVKAFTKYVNDVTFKELGVELKDSANGAQIAHNATKDDIKARFTVANKA